MKRVMALMVLAVPVLAFGADKSPDGAFFKHAAEGGIAEVEAGQRTSMTFASFVDVAHFLLREPQVAGIMKAR